MRPQMGVPLEHFHSLVAGDRHYLHDVQSLLEKSTGGLVAQVMQADNYERLPETLAGLHFVVFAMIMLVHAVPIMQRA